MGSLLGVVGLVLILASFVYSIKCYVVIFRTSGVFWVLACLAVPPAFIYWLFDNWKVGKETFLKSIAFGSVGTVVCSAGVSMM